MRLEPAVKAVPSRVGIDPQNGTGRRRNQGKKCAPMARFGPRSPKTGPKVRTFQEDAPQAMGLKAQEASAFCLSWSNSAG